MQDAGEIPPLFWRGMDFKEFKGIMDRDGLLTRAQSLRVWQILGERGPPPKGRMRIAFEAAAVEAWLAKEFPTKQ